MIHEYHVIYSVQYYPRFYVSAVGDGTYYPWIRRHYIIHMCALCYISHGKISLCLPASLTITRIAEEGVHRSGGKETDSGRSKDSQLNLHQC
jgi:hypothetical protein